MTGSLAGEQPYQARQPRLFVVVSINCLLGKMPTDVKKTEVGTSVLKLVHGKTTDGSNNPNSKFPSG